MESGADIGRRVKKIASVTRDIDEQRSSHVGILILARVLDFGVFCFCYQLTGGAERPTARRFGPINQTNQIKGVLKSELWIMLERG